MPPAGLRHAVPAALCAFLALTGSGCAGGQDRQAPSAPSTRPVGTSPRPTPSEPPGWQPAQVPAGSSIVAEARGSTVHVELTRHGAHLLVLHNPNELGAPLVFLVRAQQPHRLLVALPVKPNGSAGWVPTDEVRIERDRYALRVSLGAHRLEVYKDGMRAAVYPIATGSPSSPTPTGSFYISELLEAPGAFGPYAYGLSAFSDTFTEFEAGAGQIGIHGTNDDSSIGRSVSHGCIRLHGAAMAALVAEVPTGTPVTIT